MAIVQTLSLANFRNFVSSQVNLSPGFNFFYGANGAGKSSLLEALYCISCGRSFRSSDYKHLINNQASCFQIHVRLTLSDTNSVVVGFERRQDGQKTIRMDGESANIHEMVSCLPVIFLSSLSYQFFTHGPKIRRQFIDWLTFHVKPGFSAQWRGYQAALKQRNSAIKNKQSLNEVRAWDKLLVDSANAVNLMRQEVVENLCVHLRTTNKIFLPELSLDLTYYQGWRSGSDLQYVLNEELHNDRQLGYTRHGAHRADVVLCANFAAANEILSQGQQKIAIFALQLAMGSVLKQQTHATPVYLLDDLASELDEKNRVLVIRQLKETGAQVLITGIVIEELVAAIQESQAILFHVEQGSVTRMAPSETPT